MSVTLTTPDSENLVFVLAGMTAGGVKLIDQASSPASVVNTLMVRHTEGTPKSPKARRNLRLETSKVIEGITEVMSIDLTVNIDGSKWSSDEVHDRLWALVSYFQEEGQVALFLSGGIRQ